MKRCHVWLGMCILLVVVLAGCKGSPEFVNHPQPQLLVEFTSFTEVGCPPDERGVMRCEADSPLASIGCDRIEEPLALLGGLSPAYPMAVCYFETRLHWDDPDMNFQAEAEGYLYETGGLSPAYIRYVIFRDGKFQMIKTQAEFKEVFAPVQSSDEALSYALALGDYSAYYGLAPERGLRYLVSRIEDTYVEAVDKGYLVHLYYYQFFGCGPHTTSAIDLLVTPEGDTQEIKVEGVFEDPEQDALCVD
jgi:hypothetical protein